MKKVVISLLLVFLCALTCLYSTAQADAVEGVYLGRPLPVESLRPLENFALSISNGVPYIITRDMSTTSATKITNVYKYENDSWAIIGDSTSLVDINFYYSFDVYNNQPYIAYIPGFSNIKYPCVKKLNATTNNWELVGDLSNSPINDDPLYNNISLKVYNGIPYIAFISSSDTVKVMKFNGNLWEIVGEPLIIPDYYANSIYLQIDEGIPYVAWARRSYTSAVSYIDIARYQNNQWSTLPNPNGITLTTIAQTDLDFCIDHGNVYLAYQENVMGRNPNASYDQTPGEPNAASSHSPNDMLIYKHDGISWVKMKSPSHRFTIAPYCNIEAGSGEIYIALDSRIYKYDHSTDNWITFSTTYDTKMWTMNLIYSNNNLYFAFGNRSGKADVRRYTLPESDNVNTLEPSPLALTLSAEAGAGYVTLNWQESSESENILGYYIYKSKTPGAQTTLAETDFWVNGKTYTDIKIDAGTTYYYIVKPVMKDHSIGSASNEAAATPKTGSGSIKLTIGSPNMIVNGQIKEIDPGIGTAPEIKDGRTSLPIRGVIEEMGGVVGWVGSEQKITIDWNGISLAIWLGKKDILVNGQKKTMDVAPYISSTGRTMIPLRFVGENMGCVISWDGSTQSATIIYDMPALGQNVNNTPNVSGEDTQSGTAIPDTNTTGSGPMQNTLPWTGVWETDFGTMILTQVENTVSGVFGSEDYIIQGTVTGNKFSGTFEEGDYAGQFEFEIFSNRSIKGKYKYSEDEEWSMSWSGYPFTSDFGTIGTVWGGVWYTDYGTMVLYQNGSSVHGYYQGSNLYSISGSISGNELRGTFDEGDDYEGVIVFRLYSDQKNFTGQWKYNSDDDWGEWNGTKKK